MTRLDTLTAKLRRQLGNLDTALYPDSVLHEAINSAHTFILDRYQHQNAKVWFRFSTSAGVANYNLPQNFGAVLKVFDVAQGYSLIKAQSADIPTLGTLAQGRPRWYDRRGPIITLFATPSTVYSIGVQALVTYAPLVEDGDLTLIDPTWDDGLLRRARYEYYDNLAQDVTKAQIALASFTEWISTKVETDTRELSDLDRGISASARVAERREFDTPSSSGFLPDQSWFNERFPE
jgi:hypothetical protein